MTGENISGQQAQAPGSAAPQNASTTEQQPQETKPLTLQDVERIAEEKATRIAQSMVDKAEYRISKKAQDQISALELNKSVLGLDDTQVQQAKQKIIMDELTAPSQPEAQPSTQQPVFESQPQGDPVLAFAQSVFDEVGTTVTPNDPEWAKIKEALDKNFNDPTPAALARVTAAFTVAAQTKAARVSTNQEAAAARVGSGGAVTNGTNLDPNAPASSFWKEAYKDK